VFGGQILPKDIKKHGINPSQGEPMRERFSDVEKAFLINQPSMEERLKAYPELKAKLESMLAMIENAGGDVEKAAEAGRRIIEELRQMGNEVLHSRQQQKKEEEYNVKAGVNRKGKNPLWQLSRRLCLTRCSSFPRIQQCRARCV
jgi:hypothetical protein